MTYLALSFPAWSMAWTKIFSWVQFSPLPEISQGTPFSYSLCVKFSIFTVLRDLSTLPPLHAKTSVEGLLSTCNSVSLIHTLALALASEMNANLRSSTWLSSDLLTTRPFSLNPQILGFPCNAVSKESACNAGDQGLIPGWERSPGEGNGSPFQYSCLENPMDRGAWRATVHVVTRVRRDLTTKLPPPELKEPFEGS